MNSYTARIFFDAAKDDYNEGESTKIDNSWTETLTAKTKEELKQQICEATFTDWQDITQEDLNDYPTATEYWTTYLANANNEGKATEAEVAAWKKGKLELWAISCHILVSKLTEAKAVL